MPLNARFYSSNVEKHFVKPKSTLIRKLSQNDTVRSFQQWCQSSLRGRKKKNNRQNRYQLFLKCHLLLLIDPQCGGRDNCIFWSDLASSQHTIDVQTWLPSENIDFVKRENSPPNCPQLRPFEHFWSILKQFVYEN